MDKKRSQVLKRIENEVPLEQLSFYYDLLRVRLSKEIEVTKTYHEKRLFEAIRDVYGGPVYTSMWIGNVNVDIFLPDLKGELTDESNTGLFGPRVFKGLAIEVDGSIHDREFKMKKDNHKYAVLHYLEIAVLTVENRDLFSSQANGLLNALRGLPKVSSRQKKKLLRNIYITTILAHCDDDELNDMFSRSGSKLLKNNRNVLNLL